MIAGGNTINDADESTERTIDRYDDVGDAIAACPDRNSDTGNSYRNRWPPMRTTLTSVRRCNVAAADDVDPA